MSEWAEQGCSYVDKKKVILRLNFDCGENYYEYRKSINPNER